jgi:2-hydroxychromene-2-carboxylate isomerase
MLVVLERVSTVLQHVARREARARALWVTHRGARETDELCPAVLEACWQDAVLAAARTAQYEPAHAAVVATLQTRERDGAAVVEARSVEEPAHALLAVVVGHPQVAQSTDSSGEFLILVRA